MSLQDMRLGVAREGGHDGDTMDSTASCVHRQRPRRAPMRLVAHACATLPARSGAGPRPHGVRGTLGPPYQRDLVAGCAGAGRNGSDVRHPPRGTAGRWQVVPLRGAAHGSQRPEHGGRRAGTFLKRAFFRNVC